METYNAILIPCIEIKIIIDKMVAKSEVTDDEAAKALVHTVNCQECLNYMSSKLNSEK